MRSTPQDRTPRGGSRRSANDRLKSLWGPWLSASLVAAVAVHAAALVYWPSSEGLVRAAPLGGEASQIVALSVPGVEQVTRAPARIAAPALPTVADLQLDLPAEVAAPLPTFSELAVEEPIAPAVLTLHDEWLDYANFAPILVAPFIENRTEMRRFLERNYRPIVEFSGAQGVVEVHFWIDERGGVARAELAESSGSRSLDRLAIRLSRILRFSPARRLGQPVRVLVRLPITFRHTE